MSNASTATNPRRLEIEARMRDLLSEADSLSPLASWNTERLDEISDEVDALADELDTIVYGPVAP